LVDFCLRIFDAVEKLVFAHLFPMHGGEQGWKIASGCGSVVQGFIGDSGVPNFWRFASPVPGSSY
jgi:hypothetical protein